MIGKYINKAAPKARMAMPAAARAGKQPSTPRDGMQTARLSEIRPADFETAPRVYFGQWSLLSGMVPPCHT
jgi:hypothetical protein